MGLPAPPPILFIYYTAAIAGGLGCGIPSLWNCLSGCGLAECNCKSCPCHPSWTCLGMAQGCQAQPVPSGAGTRLGVRCVYVPGGSSQPWHLQALLLLEAAKAPHSPAFSTSTKCETVPARGGSCETQKGRLESQLRAWGRRGEPEERLNAGPEAQKASLLLPADTSLILPPCRAGKGLPRPGRRLCCLSGRLSRPPSPKWLQLMLSLPFALTEQSQFCRRQFPPWAQVRGVPRR